MQGCCCVRFWHGGDARWIAVPSTDSVHGGNHSQSSHIAGATRQKILARRVTCCGGVGRETEAIGKIGLQKALDAVQVFENELVARVQLDTGFSVNAFRVEFRTQSAFRPRAVAAGFPRPADFALFDSQSQLHAGPMGLRVAPYRNGCAPAWIVYGIRAGPLLCAWARLAIAGGCVAVRVGGDGSIVGHLPVGAR